ncbi:hypothetical protein VWM83_09335, partial [Campylobacter coli]
PIILFGSEFWQGFDEFVRNSLLKLEVISKGDELKYEITDDLESEIRSIPTISGGSTYSINQDSAVSVSASLGGSSAAPDAIFGI